MLCRNIGKTLNLQLSRWRYFPLPRSYKSSNALVGKERKSLFVKEHTQNPSLNLTYNLNHTGTVKHACVENINGLYDKISKANTIEELENIVDGYTDSLESAHIAAACVRLMNLAYNEQEAIPWFQSHNFSIAYVQLIMNGNLNHLMEPYLRSSLFSKLYALVNDQLPSLCAGEQADILMSLLQIGLQNTDDLLVRILQGIPVLMRDATAGELVKISEVLHAAARNCHHFKAKLIQRYLNLVEQNEFSEVDLCSMHCRFLMSMSNYLTFGRNCELLEKVLDIIDKNPSYMKDPLNLGSIVRMYRKLPKRADLRERQAATIANALKCLDISTLKDYHIAELCSSLKTVRLYEKDSALRFEQRALDVLLSNNIKVSNVSNLLYAFSRETSIENKRLAENALYQHMQNADVLILSNLAESLRFMNCRNRDIIHVFHELVMQNLHNIFSFATRFEKIMRFLQWRNFTDIRMQQKFNQVLFDYLTKSQIGLMSWYVSIATNYLLMYSHCAFPELFFDRLLLSIRRMRIEEMLLVMAGLRSMTRNMYMVPSSQVETLESTLYDCVFSKLDSINSIILLNRTLLEILLRNRKRDPNVMEKLISLYPRLMNNLNHHSLKRLLEILNRLKYYQPEVLDKLETFVRSNWEGLDSTSLVSILMYMSTVGYAPSESFLKTCLKMYHKIDPVNDLYDQLNIIWFFTDVQFFPKEELLACFSMEFLEQVDRHLEDCPESRPRVESLMMKLNRTVVLDCPELDIPWFHEDYCEKNIVMDNPIQLPFLQQVRDGLSDALGGIEFIKEWVFSPYYYHINFEIWLNSNGIPILPVKANTNIAAHKVAVRTLLESNYCYHKQRLTGFEKTKNRHLELLGYTVVEIPYFEWQSMALTDWSSRLTYIKNKIKLLR